MDRRTVFFFLLYMLIPALVCASGFTGGGSSGASSGSGTDITGVLVGNGTTLSGATGTTGYVPYWSSSSLADSKLYYDNSQQIFGVNRVPHVSAQQPMFAVQGDGTRYVFAVFDAVDNNSPIMWFDATASMWIRTTINMSAGSSISPGGPFMMQVLSDLDSTGTVFKVQTNPNGGGGVNAGYLWTGYAWNNVQTSQIHSNGDTYFGPSATRILLNGSAGTATIPVSTLTPQLYGSSAANGDVFIDGTSHATKTTSYVLIQSGGGLTAVGNGTPTGDLHVFGNNGLNVESTTGNTIAVNLYSGNTRYGSFGAAGTTGSLLSTSSGGDIVVKADSTNVLFGIGSTEYFRIMTVGAIVAPPSTETIASAATITANACGGLKAISASGAVTTNTTDTFTAPASTPIGCIMDVCNVGTTNTITLDHNAHFFTLAAGDLVLAANTCVRIGNDGTQWRQLTGLLTAS